jgi:hypothetical protein
MKSDGKRDLLCVHYADHKLFRAGIMTLVYCQIVTVNAIISRLFNILGEYQRKHTTIDSKKKSMTQILFQEVLNTGIIITFASFDPTGLVEKMSTKPANIEVGQITYNMFEYTWYFDVGVNICIALVMSIFTSNIIEYLTYVKAALKRL